MEAVIETSQGTMRAQLFTENAPITTQNFIDLAQSGFYQNMVFHRVEPGFVIQTGDPSGMGYGGSEKTIPLEIHPELRHDSVGVLGMARSQDPNSASSQFYITLGPTAFLDDNYAVFGKLTEGADIASKIQVGDELVRVSIEEAQS